MRKLMVMLLASFSLCSLLSAATNYITWQGYVDQDWNNAANWDNYVFDTDPNNPNFINVYNSSNDPIADGTVAPPEFTELKLGLGYDGVNATSDLVGLTVNGAHLDMMRKEDGASGYFNVGHFGGTNTYLDFNSGLLEVMMLSAPRYGYAEVNMTGGEMKLDLIRMGGFSGHGGGVFNMTGGTITLDDYAPYTQYLGIGYVDGGLCTFNISGSSVINANGIYIGMNGDAVMNIDGGTIHTSIAFRSSNTNSISTINMTAGQVTADGIGVYIGYGGTPSTMNMSGGQVDCTIFNVGRNNIGNESNLVNLSGGVITAAYDNSNVEALQFNLAEGAANKLNLCGGTFIWKNYATSSFSGYIEDHIAAGRIVAYGGSGRVSNINGTLTAEETSHNPTPGLDEQIVSPAVGGLSWENPYAGQSVNVKVWFGTDETMASATMIASGTDITSATLPLLSPETTYYWRVDTDSPLATTGEIWSFTTNIMGTQNPAPADEATGILKSQVLSWDMAGTFDTVNVYIGTVSTSLALVHSQSASDLDYHYDALGYGNTYYWRVDSVVGGATTTGLIWSFDMIDPTCEIDAEDGDINGDCVIDMNDFATISAYWLYCGWDVSEACN